MKRTLIALISAAMLSVCAAAFAANSSSTPDCSEKQKAYDTANSAVTSAEMPDLASCKRKKGKEKTDCEKLLEDKAKADTKAAKDSAKQAKMALDCCKNPKRKGCTP